MAMECTQAFSLRAFCHVARTLLTWRGGVITSPGPFQQSVAVGWKAQAWKSLWTSDGRAATILASWDPSTSETTTLGAFQTRSRSVHVVRGRQVR